MWYYFLAFLCLYLFYTFHWKRRNLPPGPVPLPFLGNFLSLVGGKRIETQLIKWRKQYGDVYTIWFGTFPMVTINSYELLDKYMVKSEKFAGRIDVETVMKMVRGGTYGVFDTKGELWKIHKRFALKFFKEKGMGKDQMEKRIMDEVRYVIEQVNRAVDRGEEEINLLDYSDIAIGSVINSVVCGYRMTIENRDEEFRIVKTATTELMKNLTSLLATIVLFNPILFNVPYINHKAKKVTDNTRIVQKFMKERIDEHLKNNDYSHEFEPEDYIDAYLLEKARLDAQGGPHLFSIEQLVNVGLDLWLAGQETTSNTLNWTVSYLVGHPNCQEKLFNELDSVIGSNRLIHMSDKNDLPYTNAVIMEVQRCANLIGMSGPRTAEEDVVIEGYTIPKGTGVIAQISTVMYDEKFFKDPYQFNPERFFVDGKFKANDLVIPFSLGKRSCLGEGLARMELFLFVANLFNQFRFSAGKIPPTMNKVSANAFNTEAFKCKIQKIRHIHL